MCCDCEGHDKDFAKWTGIWPGDAESRFLDIDLNQFHMLGYPGIFFVKKGEDAPQNNAEGAGEQQTTGQAQNAGKQ